jgi:hypothetical protein
MIPCFSPYRLLLSGAEFQDWLTRGSDRNASIRKTLPCFLHRGLREWIRADFLLDPLVFDNQSAKASFHHLSLPNNPFQRFSQTRMQNLQLFSLIEN